MGELYALPEGWAWKKLGDIVKIIGGGTPSKKVKEYWNNGTIRWATVGDMNVETIVDTELKITEEGLKESSANIVPKEAIVIATRVGLGKVCYLDSDTAINQDLKGLLPASDELNVKFLYNFFKYIEKDIIDNGTGATVKGVKLDFIKSIRVPLPSLQEQKRIVAKLDILFERIDRAIALHQQNIDEADALMGAVLNEVFGELEGKYGKRNLASFDPNISAGGTPLRKEKAYWNGNIEWYSSGELNQLYTLPSKEKITQLGLENSSAKLFSKGTLLIGMYDTAAMKMSILSNDASCNQAIVGFKPKENELNILFVKYQLEYLKEKILEQRQGVRQKNLNLTKIKNIIIEYPPLKTQQKTAQYLDRIARETEKLKQVQQQKLQQLKDLKASILDRAFRGEL